MTPVTPQKTARLPYGNLVQVLFVISGCLFIIGAFAADGDSLGGIPVLTWICGGFAAIALAVAV